jgi:hypothetical protein
VTRGDVCPAPTGSGLVPVSVVDVLEMVDVEHPDAQMVLFGPDEKKILNAIK